VSLVLCYGSGSPHAWKVQLAPEHKALPYLASTVPPHWQKKG
jgi:hypothetical protein